MRKYIMLILVLLLFNSVDNKAQIIRTRLDFVGGLAYPEFFHMGLRYQYSDVGQIGFFYGGDMGIKPTIIRTWTGDHLFHFGKHSYSTNRLVWYARQGFTYAVHTTNDFIYKYSYIDLSLGREFSISEWLGFNADMGFLGQIREKKIFKGVDRDPAYRTKWQWYPLLRFQIFISI
jgi:hypothetical protein